MMSPKVVRCRKPHVCSDCGAAIAVGASAVVTSEMFYPAEAAGKLPAVSLGFPRSVYHCVSCHPVKEA